MSQSKRLRPPVGRPFCVKCEIDGVGSRGTLGTMAAVSRDGNEPLQGVVGDPGAVSEIGTETLRLRKDLELVWALSKPSGAEGTLPIGRAETGRGGSPGSSSSWVRVLARLMLSMTELTEGLRLEGCRFARKLGVEALGGSGTGSSLGRGGGGKVVVVGGIARGSTFDIEESARGRVPVSIFNSWEVCPDSLRARTPGTGGGPIGGGGG